MKLQIVTTFSLDSRSFRTLGQAQEHLVNEIGKIIDSTPLPLMPKDKLAVFNAIIKNKERLVELLTVTYKSDDPDVDDRNLLDLDI